MKNVRIDFVFRSPDAIYKYFGKVLRDQTGSRIRLSSSELANIDGGPIPNIVRGQGPGCFVSAHYAGDAYCVPNEALATAMVFDVLQQLRNLSITPSDLNAAFTVRLAN